MSTVLFPESRRTPQSMLNDNSQSKQRINDRQIFENIGNLRKKIQVQES